jgi:hypothetical protein
MIGESRFRRFNYDERRLVVALGDTEMIVASRAGSLVKGLMKWPDQNVRQHWLIFIPCLCFHPRDQAFTFPRRARRNVLRSTRC